MTHAIVLAALAPLMKEPNPRSELISQLLSGETATVAEEQAPWFRIERHQDGYQGWVHRGYLDLVPEAAASRWTARSEFLAEDAILEEAGGRRILLPLLGRAAAVDDEYEVASGRRGRLVAGALHRREALYRAARALRPIDWAVAHFSGSAYHWGGITPWGVDCSGLVQTTFAARGLRLPRDSQEQAGQGLPVPADGIEPGDLLFFSESGGRITHVAFAGEDQTLVHSTLACGGFVVESWGPGSRAAFLRGHLAAIRRIPDPGPS